MPDGDLISRYRITGTSFRLAAIDPADTGPAGLGKSAAKPLLKDGVRRLVALQERLYAEHRWAVLVILQGMDTAGKDGIIKHVMSGVNPLGSAAYSFRSPTQVELDHDFLWRAHALLPRRGHIGIFNRSYYEEVLVTRVHRALLLAEGLPHSLVTDEIWQHRFEDIAAFERYLLRNGVVPIKIFLHISKEEQRRRLLSRIDDPAKQWKFTRSDVEDRQFWDQYARAYEDAILNTASVEAPWHVIPADRKWFARLAVVETLNDRIARLNPQLPELGETARADLKQARQQLTEEE